MKENPSDARGEPRLQDGAETISLRPLLRERLLPLLAERNLGSPGLVDFAAEIMGSVSRYREEGTRLFPVVFLCRNRTDLFRVCGAEDAIELGHGPAQAETALRMLKLCAPLGEGRSWVVFAETDAADQIRFGVLRAPRSPVVSTALERLRFSDDDTLQVAGFVQVAEGVVEARISGGRCLYASVEGSAQDPSPPTRVIKDFIESLRVNAPAEAHDALGRFYYRVLIDVMQVWHGTLAAVVPVQAVVKASLLSDGVALGPALDVARHVLDHLRAPSEATLARLAADANLIRGMLSADGITVFRSDGAVIAYNCFLHRSPETMLRTASTLGGARQRAFEQLSALVGDELVAAFCRSQDGSAYCRASWSPLAPREGVE